MVQGGALAATSYRTNATPSWKSRTLTVVLGQHQRVKVGRCLKRAAQLWGCDFSTRGNFDSPGTFGKMWR